MLYNDAHASILTNTLGRENILIASSTSRSLASSLDFLSRTRMVSAVTGKRRNSFISSSQSAKCNTNEQAGDYGDVEQKQMLQIQ